MFKNKPLIVIFMTVFVDLVGFGIIIPLNPYLAKQFGASAFQVGMLLSVYSALQFLMSPFWGWLSDRWGRRPIILLSLFGSSASHLLFAFSPTFLWLVVARSFAGLFGGNISAAMAYMADVTEKKDRSKGMGLIGAAFGLGFVLGPFLGGMFGKLGQYLGSEPPLGQSFAAVAASAICFTNFLIALRVLKESLPPEKRTGLPRRPPRWTLMMDYLKRPVTGPLMLIFFLLTLAMAQMEATLFLFVKDEFSWDLMTASFGFAYVGLLMVFTQGYLVRKLMPRWGERKTMKWGLILATIGLGGIGFSYQVALMAIVITSLSVGVGLANPSITGSISLKSGADEQGASLGVNQSLSALARILGPLLGGWLYQSFGHSSPFFAAGSMAGVSLGLTLLLYSRLPESGKEAE